MSQPSLAALLQQQREVWAQTETLPEKHLLRLVLLRDLSRALHAQRSRLIALGKREESHELRDAEKALEAMKFHRPFEEMPLESLVESWIQRSKFKKNEDAGPTPPPLPEDLVKTLDSKKIFRLDREWELSLIAHAVDQGWAFWSLRLAVKIMELEDWQTTFSQALWPKGIVLWTESVEQTHPRKSATSDEPVWEGRWITAIHPKVKTPSLLKLKLESFPGYFPSPKPQWELLYAPGNNAEE